MKFKLQAFDIFEFGQRKDSQGKPHQEDCLFPKRGLSTADDRLFIVCDGMGGHDAGEVASSTVCETISNYILSNLRDPEGEFTDQILQNAVQAAFTALNLKDTGALRKMGTTMTLLKLHSKGCTIAHMGDSRVYHIRPGATKDDTRIMFVTEDHSLVNELVKCGEITKEEARVHPKKNVITRALQPNMERYPKVDVYHSSDIRPGDYFYLCTDGMLENMDDEQLCYFFSAMAGDDREKINKLVKATVSNKDNHSAIMVHILDVINPIGPDAVSRKTISLAVTPECHYDANGLTNNKMPSSGYAQEERTDVIIDQDYSVLANSNPMTAQAAAPMVAPQVGTPTAAPIPTQAPTTQAPTTQIPTTQIPPTQIPPTQTPTQVPTSQAQSYTTQTPTTQVPVGGMGTGSGMGNGMGPGMGNQGMPVNPQYTANAQYQAGSTNVGPVPPANTPSMGQPSRDYTAQSAPVTPPPTPTTPTTPPPIAPAPKREIDPQISSGGSTIKQPNNSIHTQSVNSAISNLSSFGKKKGMIGIIVGGIVVIIVCLFLIQGCPSGKQVPQGHKQKITVTAKSAEAPITESEGDGNEEGVIQDEAQVDGQLSEAESETAKADVTDPTTALAAETTSTPTEGEATTEAATKEEIANAIKGTLKDRNAQGTQTGTSDTPTEK